MLWKNKTPKVELTKIEKIQQSSIEELLESCSMSSYLEWNISEIAEVLKKCETPVHFTTLYYNAVRIKNCSHPTSFDMPRTVTNEILNLIYLETCKSISLFLKDYSYTATGKVAVIKELYSYLKSPWKDQSNLPERILLQKRLEVEWGKLAREIYSTIQEKEPTDPLGYEQLFHLCKQDDPLVMEIAEKINSLS